MNKIDLLTCILAQVYRGFFSSRTIAIELSINVPGC